ncbi:hypothetical protein ACVGWX_10660, partial [Enterobacter hormaechei]
TTTTNHKKKQNKQTAPSKIKKDVRIIMVVILHQKQSQCIAHIIQHYEITYKHLTYQEKYIKKT